MTDPTTTPTPPQGLTDAQLLELAAAAIDGYAYGVYLSQKSLLAAMRAAIAADRANHLRTATKMALTPDEVEARFRAWWAESYPNAPVNSHAVRLHVDFAMYLMSGEVAA